MSKLKIAVGQCKGCGYCIASCPQKALSFSQHRNEKGYQYVQVDESKCIQCGICYHTCPDGVIEVGVE